MTTTEPETLATRKITFSPTARYGSRQGGVVAGYYVAVAGAMVGIVTRTSVKHPTGHYWAGLITEGPQARTLVQGHSRAAVAFLLADAAPAQPAMEA